MDIAKWLLIVLITIDIAISASLYVLDSEKGTEFFTQIIYKVMFSVVLIYFLMNWGDGVANFAKEMFTGFGGLIMGVSGKEAMDAVSDPMSIVSKGVHIIAPIYNAASHDKYDSAFQGGICSDDVYVYWKSRI